MAVKRVLDTAVAFGLLLVLSPVLLTTAAAVKLTSRGPILFKQERIGRNGSTFEMLKFRSMIVDNSDAEHRAMNQRELLGEDVADEDGVHKLANDPRFTPIGSVIRRYSIDELPQLWNVVRGEMALVGPRPSLDWEVELYDTRHRRRELVRPGLTGLWQVSGRNHLSMLQMLELDVQYVESLSLMGDMRILLRTPAAVLSGGGAR
ncbi:MAG: sugar transferase [Actinomycetota bacterium]